MIIKLILFLNILVLNVNAETFYTNYKLIDSNTKTYHEEYENNELYKIDSKVAYNNYKIVRANEGYYEYKTAPAKLTNLDIYDFITKESYSKSFQTIEDELWTTNKITKYNSTRYITLRRFYTNNAILKAIKVYTNNKEINFTYAKNNYNFIDYLNFNHNIVIDLGRHYDLENLKLEMVFLDDTLSDIIFMLDIFENSYINGQPHIYYDNNLYRHNKEETYYVNFLNENSFLDLLKQTTWIRKNSYDSLNGVTYFKKITKLYKYYQNINEYLDIYTLTPIEGCSIDYFNPVTLYDYYKRDYIEVKDIVNEESDLDNIIESSSVPSSDINIDYIKDDNNPNELLLKLSYQDNTFFKKLNIEALNQKEENSVKDFEESIIQEKEEVTSSNEEEVIIDDLENNVNELTINAKEPTQDLIVDSPKQENNKLQVITQTSTKKTQKTKLITTKKLTTTFKTTKEVITTTKSATTTNSIINSKCSENISKYNILYSILLFENIIIFLTIMCKFLKDILKKKI